uniref:Uncharacterized protein n=1 Tax=Leersia perrieri TaxID=77586 RepID=A0A0D9XUB2_9ORYZ
MQEKTTLLQVGHVTDGEMRADGEAQRRRRRRRRRVAGPRRHDRLRHGRRRRGLHRQRHCREFRLGDAGADAGVGGDVDRRRPRRLLHLPGRLTQLK